MVLCVGALAASRGSSRPCNDIASANLARPPRSPGVRGSGTAVPSRRVAAHYACCDVERSPPSARGVVVSQPQLLITTPPAAPAGPSPPPAGCCPPTTLYAAIKTVYIHEKTILRRLHIYTHLEEHSQRRDGQIRSPCQASTNTFLGFLHACRRFLTLFLFRAAGTMAIWYCFILI